MKTPEEINVPGMDLIATVVKDKSGVDLRGLHLSRAMLAIAETMIVLQKEVDTERARAEKLVEALRYYATAPGLSIMPVYRVDETGDLVCVDSKRDQGDVARQALAELENIK